MPVAAVVDVALQLIGIGLPLADPVAVLAAPAGQRADAGHALVVDDVVGVVAIPGAAVVLVDEARQAQARAELDEHVLERAHVAVGLDHGVADRVARPVGVADRPVEQADAVVAFQIGRVRQDEIGVGHGLGVIGVRVDDERYLVGAGSVRVGQHGEGLDGVHRRVPRHVGHVDHQRIDGVRIAGPGVADHRVHQAVGGERGLPGVGLVDAHRCAGRVDEQVLGRGHAAERHAGERCHGPAAILAARFGAGRRRLREGRLEAEAARHVDGAEQRLQQVDAPGRCENRWNGPRCRAWRAWRRAAPAWWRGGGRPSRSRRRAARSPARRRRGQARQPPA